MGFAFEVHYWPILTAVWFAVTFVVAYLISVLNKHVYPFLPYISDTGTTRPESCYFGQLLNLGALFMGITMYIRYKQVELAIKAKYIDINPKWNVVCKWFGIIACLGMSFVANFQETAIPVMHFFGAIMSFGIGSVFFIIQSQISNAFRASRTKNATFSIGEVMYFSRLIMSTLFLPLFLTNMGCSIASMLQFDGDSIIWWTPEHKAYGLHMVGTFTEWILVVVMIAYVLSFVKEFKKMTFEEIAFKNKAKYTEVPMMGVESSM